MPPISANRAGVILAVDDVAALTDFYTTHLGFTVEAQYESPAYTTLVNGATRLSLAEQGHPANDLPGFTMTVLPQGPTPNHCLVLEVDDCDAAYEQLRSAGVEVRSEVFRPPWGGARFFLTDPEGNLIELETLA
ncbi:VOC family protein [Ruicaihuangia caeni]|uniref:VOC family protein n=1 Tax=Ruicaihuangia caeni TaxID=3042517 RepID=A0AAW6TA08_9MICO|nr:VOC family protein [Klugiella sp. YN-L-19]MDI2098598.1 VOC family protein [Klugiella sp. YN-L-19]